MWFSWISVALLLCFITSCVESDFNSFHIELGLEDVVRSSKYLRLRRNVYESQTDLTFAQEFFTTSVQSSLDNLTRTQSRTLLIQTRLEGQNDSLLLVKNGTVMNTVSFQPLSYYNLAAVSHLPVTVVSILVPNIVETNTSSDNVLCEDTKKRLEEFCIVLQNVSRLLNEGAVFADTNQTSRGNEIIENVSQLVNNSLNTGSITADKLNQFARLLNPQLKENARDSVMDYLVCLNNSIEELNVSSSHDNVSVVIALHPFAYPNSFLVQYYEQLLNVSLNDGMDPDRIILHPSQLDKQSCSSNFTQEFDTAEPSVCAFSNASLQHRISEIFNGEGNATTSVHALLSEAANELICSDSFTLPTCQGGQQNMDQPIRVIGFQTRMERGFIVLIIFFASMAVVFGITVLCIFYEDRLMKRESMSVRLERLQSKYKGPTLFTPVEATESFVEERTTDFSVTDSQVLLQS